MNRKPLLARASFDRTELTEEQIARVSGGDEATELTEGGGGGCTSQNPAWSVKPTWDTTKANPYDQKSVCTDPA